MQLVVEVEQRALTAGRDQGLGLPEEGRDGRPRQLEQGLAGRRPQMQEQHVGGGVRGPQADVAVAGGPVEPGLEQLATQQPGDAGVVEVHGAALVADVTEGDPDGERVGAVVAEQCRDRSTTGDRPDEG